MSEFINQREKQLLPLVFMNKSNLFRLKTISSILQKQIINLKKSYYYQECQQPLEEKNNFQTDSKEALEKISSNSHYEWLMKNKKEYGKIVIQGNNEYLFCTICHKYFPDEQAILQHKERAHCDKSEVFQCNFCSKYFNGELSLLNHKFQYHQSKRSEMKQNKKQKIREELQKDIYNELI